MKLSKIRYDVDKAEGGAWVDVPGTHFAGVSLKVRSRGTVEYRRRQRQLEAGVARRIGTMLDPEDEDRIDATLLHELVLLDWAGLEEDDGTAIPYSPERAKALLFDPCLAAFRSIVRLAADIQNERGRADLAADVGN